MHVYGNSEYTRQRGEIFFAQNRIISSENVFWDHLETKKFFDPQSKFLTLGCGSKNHFAPNPTLFVHKKRFGTISELFNFLIKKKNFMQKLVKHIPRRYSHFSEP